MPKQSAGLLMYRRCDAVEVLLVHPGGPFWAKKDDGAWSIPKGLFDDGEEALAAAKREFEEETGQAPPAGPFTALGVFKQPGGKHVHAWAVEGAFDVGAFKSNLFAMEWPPRSGRMAEFPEADRAGWFGRQEALTKITKGQRAIVEALFAKLEAA
jgi:predicted NUDIX family NTP pyrophosphohydrolase